MRGCRIWSAGGHQLEDEREDEESGKQRRRVTLAGTYEGGRH